MPAPKKRRSRHQREAQPRTLTLTPRDLDIFELLYKRRGATTEQIAQLLQNQQENSRLRTRLADLFHNRYVRRHFLGTPYGIAPSKIVHLLDRKGARLLSEQRGFPVKSSSVFATLTQEFLEHSLAINDVEIAMRKCCTTLGYSLDEWHYERFIKADYDHVTLSNGELHAVQPDSYAAVTVPRKLVSATTRYLIEMDRGTEVRRQFEPKITAYIAYFASSECRARYGTYKLRVLIVTSSDRRLANIKKITERVGGKSRFWFTTLARITQDNPLSSSIWQVAGREGTHALLVSDLKMGLPQFWQPH